MLVVKVTALLKELFLFYSMLADLKTREFQWSLNAFQGQQDLQEVVNHWKQVTHIMAKWFPEDNVEEKPKDFISKFLSGVE